MTDKLYAERDLGKQGDYYIKHLSALTSEELRGKSAIAAELAHRDILIDQIKESFKVPSRLLKQS